MIDQQRPSPKVTLEELLRLKRAERPPAEFWVDFERSLRAKQLAALVQKRPWWKTWTGFSRWSIPVGAAAALGVTIVSFSSRPKSDVLQVTDLQERAVASETTLPRTQVLVAQETDQLPLAVEAHAAEVTVDVPDAVEPSAAPVPPSHVLAHVASVVEQVAGIAQDRDNGSAGASFAGEPVNATASMASFTFSQPMSSESSAGVGADRNPAIEPLAQLSTPRDARRARLLAFTSSVDTRTPQYSNSMGVIRSRERIANHLNDEALYDSIRRLGVKGSGVSIQF